MSAADRKRPRMRLDSICLDCAWDQLDEMIAFYQALLDWPPDTEDEGMVSALLGPGVSLSFQPVTGYQPPTWPSEVRGKQIHLDIVVDDLVEAVEYARSIGAQDASAQYGDTWFVMLDPAGHPFCLTLNALMPKHQEGA